MDYNNAIWIFVFDKSFGYIHVLDKRLSCQYPNSITNSSGQINNIHYYFWIQKKAKELMWIMAWLSEDKYEFWWTNRCEYYYVVHLCDCIFYLLQWYIVLFCNYAYVCEMCLCSKWFVSKVLCMKTVMLHSWWNIWYEWPPCRAPADEG